MQSFNPTTSLTLTRFVRQGHKGSHYERHALRECGQKKPYISLDYADPSCINISASRLRNPDAKIAKRVVQPTRKPPAYPKNHPPPRNSPPSENHPVYLVTRRLLKNRPSTTRRASRDAGVSRQEESEECLIQSLPIC